MNPAAGLIGRPPQHLFKKHLSMVLPESGKTRPMTAVKDKVITVNSNVIIVSVHTIEYTSVQHGYIVLLKKFTDLEQEQYKIRRQVMSKGHAAKYTFDDIVGNQPGNPAD